MRSTSCTAFSLCNSSLIQEEMGLTCEVLDSSPTIAYTAIDQEGQARLMLFYKINLPSLNFTPCDECVAIKFWNKDDMRSLKMCPQIGLLVNHL